MSPAPQVEECHWRVDDEIALDSTCLLRKVVHNTLELSCARARQGQSRVSSGKSAAATVNGQEMMEMMEKHSDRRAQRCRLRAAACRYVQNPSCARFRCKNSWPGTRAQAWREAARAAHLCHGAKSS